MLGLARTVDLSVVQAYRDGHSLILTCSAYGTDAIESIAASETAKRLLNFPV